MQSVMMRKGPPFICSSVAKVFRRRRREIRRVRAEIGKANNAEKKEREKEGERERERERRRERERGREKGREGGRERERERASNILQKDREFMQMSLCKAGNNFVEFFFYVERIPWLP